MTRFHTLGLALSLVLGACDEEDTPGDTTTTCAPNCDNAFVARGDSAAGHRVHEVDGMLLKAWYPTHASATAVDYAITIKFPQWPANPATIHGEAALDAEVSDGGPYPLVVLSHGFSGNPEWYRTLAEHLASHGFVVLAPEHPESDWFTDVVPASITRPREVSAAIDFALSGPYAAVIDSEAIAVLGHSYGGYTALAAAGARFDLQDLAQRCVDVEDEFTAAYFCSTFLDQQEQLAEGLGIDVPTSGLWPSLADDRIDAIVSLAGDAYLFGAQGLAEVTVPVLSLGGTADSGTPWDWGTALTHEHVGSTQRVLVGLEGGEHFLPTASCDDMPWTADLPDIQQAMFCSDPAWDKQVGLDHVHHFTTAFLRATLRDDALAHEALQAEHYDGAAGLQYASTL